MSEAIHYRHPALEDGRRVWELVREAGTLDHNSAYLYLLLCDRFADTCVVAERQGEPVGFVTAFLTPGRPDTLFVWQIGVAPAARGRGVARRLLEALLVAEACREVKWLETTISPANTASRALFSSLALRLGTELNERPYMEEGHFPAVGNHEAEPLLRIGPIPTRPSPPQP